jgi:hypothetical protein
MNGLELIKSVLPWIGTALGGPLGGMAATYVGNKLGMSEATVDNVKAVLSGMPPEKLAELRLAELDFKLKMETLGYTHLYKIEELNINAAVQNASDINKTMQTEAGSEHWPTYSWRPAIGFAVAFNLASASIVVFIAYIWQPELVNAIPNMLTAQAGLNAVAMPILGIASWFRGKAQEAAIAPMVPTTQQITTTSVTSKG